MWCIPNTRNGVYARFVNKERFENNLSLVTEQCRNYKHCLGGKYLSCTYAINSMISNFNLLTNDVAASLLSGVPDLWDRTKILRCGDLPHLHVPDCIWVFFCFVWYLFIHHNIHFYFELCTYLTVWIFTYYKIWILLNIYCFIWNYWTIYCVTCFEVFWSVMS